MSALLFVVVDPFHRLLRRRTPAVTQHATSYEPRQPRPGRLGFL